MAQPRTMFYKGKNQALEAGRHKQDQMRVIRSNENTLKKTFLDENCTKNHNTTNCGKNDQKKKRPLKKQVTKVQKGHKILKERYRIGLNSH